MHDSRCLVLGERTNFCLIQVELEAAKDVIFYTAVCFKDESRDIFVNWSGELFPRQSGKVTKLHKCIINNWNDLHFGTSLSQDFVILLIWYIIHPRLRITSLENQTDLEGCLEGFYWNAWNVHRHEQVQQTAWGKTGKCSNIVQGFPAKCIEQTVLGFQRFDDQLRHCFRYRASDVADSHRGLVSSPKNYAEPKLIYRKSLKITTFSNVLNKETMWRKFRCDKLPIYTRECVFLCYFSLNCTSNGDAARIGDFRVGPCGKFLYISQITWLIFLRLRIFCNMRNHSYSVLFCSGFEETNAKRR